MSKTRDNSQALAAFVVCKSEIDAILARVGRLSAEHFDRMPGDITWADVGTVSSYLKGCAGSATPPSTRANTQLDRAFRHFAPDRVLC